MIYNYIGENHVEYVAVPATAPMVCEGCEFSGDFEGCQNSPRCIFEGDDGNLSTIIWVKKNG